jgi:predicted kinase
MASPLLIALAGLPGSGKSTLAQALAERLRAVWVRIDTIEQAIRDAGIAQDGPAGYIVGYGIAATNLRLGHIVVADSVNPIAITRDAWRNVATEAGARCLEVEVICSDPAEHRRRVETRVVNVPGLVPPTWQEVVARQQDPWTRPRLVIDTAGRGIEACVVEVLARLE